MRRYLVSILWTIALALVFWVLVLLLSILLPFVPEDVRVVVAAVASLVLLILGIGQFGEQTFRLKH